MNFYNESQFNSMKLAEITDHYNVVAKEIGVKAVKKFRDKPTAISRTLQAQEMLQEDIQDNAEAEAAPVELTDKPKGKKGTRFDLGQVVTIVKGEPKEGSIEHSLFLAINEGLCTTCAEVVEYIVANHKRPRSGMGVDAQYAIHNIKWFVRKGHLKLS